MDLFACALIDALGGTTGVAELMDAPPSTVSNMRSKLTRSRLNHLRRIAIMERPSLNVEELAAQHGVELPPIAVPEQPSVGNGHDLTAAVPA